MATPVSVPRYAYKYFRVGDLQEFVDANLGTANQVDILQIQGDLIAEKMGAKLRGWAFAKDRYLDKLVENGYGVMGILHKGNEKFIANILDEDVNIITREMLDACFEDKQDEE